MRVAIVEDDLSSQRLLSEHLARFAAESGTDIQITSFSNGMELISSYRAEWDVILLDIEMPVMDGMSAARQIREADKDVFILFITAFAQYAVDSYSVSALDYVLKPVNYYAFSPKLKRIQNLLRQRTDRSIVIRNSDGFLRLPLRDIYYIEILNHALTYHTTHGLRSSTGSTTIKKLEESLSGDGYVRCSQGHLVNLRCVDTVDKESLRLVNGEQIPISRNRRKTFLQAFLNYWSA